MVLEAGYGTGRARLEILSGQEIVEDRVGVSTKPPNICNSAFCLRSKDATRGSWPYY